MTQAEHGIGFHHTDPFKKGETAAEVRSEQMC